MRVLLVEDDYAVSQSIETMLKKEGMIVDTTDLGEDGLEIGKLYDYDIIILDLMLPDMNGYEVLKNLRAAKVNTPVLILSGLSEPDKKVKGLGYGADDYLTKPFHLAELNARIKSVIRRKQQDGELQLSLANLTIYPDKHSVYINGKEIVLNRKEFDLLYYFISNPNRLISKATLAESVWGDYIDQADNFDFIYSQVKNLRKKLKAAGAIPEIKAVYGFGYKMTDEE